MNDQLSTAPALLRGIRIFELLSNRGELSLEAVASETGYPKSSILRVLDTLSALDLVVRDPGTRRYSATALLIRRTAPDASFDQRIARSLADLAESTGNTAEWYVSVESGMALVQRAQPAEGIVHVRAKIGFIRTWTGELEAVNALGRAFFNPSADCRGNSGYTSDGLFVKLSAKHVADRVRSASNERAIMDDAFNTNGVRRMAAVVFRSGQPTGIVSLAEHSRPGTDGCRQKWFDQLKDAARALSQ